ncbi:MAG: DUF5337 domain-containing protein [Roseovarius sp.]|nr:DUF5337 domain-containing protein [Roseovarius sp.]
MTQGTGHTEQMQGRRAALVIAGTAVLWVLATFIGGRMGLSPHMLVMADMAALGGFIWALWMVFNIWRSRQDNQG